MNISDLVQAAGWTLAHFVWQGAVVALLVAVLLWVLKPALARYLAAVGGLVALLGLAAGTFGVCLQGGAVSLPEAGVAVEPSISEPVSTVEGFSVDGGALGSRSNTPNGTYSDTDTDTAIATTSAATNTTANANISTNSIPWQHWVVALWLCGVGAFALRFFLDWRATLRLKKTSTPLAAESPWPERLAVLAERIRVSRSVRLLTSTAVQIPVALGVLRPVVIVPLSMLANLPPAQVDAILLHELAHIRRHDFLVNLLQSAAEALFFFHPAVWWISRHIREERENCCDDLAASHCENVSAYAGALAALEESRGNADVALGVAADGGKKRGLVGRIRRLAKDEEAARCEPGWALLCASGLGVFLFALLLLTINPGFARDDARTPTSVRVFLDGAEQNAPNDPAAFARMILTCAKSSTWRYNLVKIGEPKPKWDETLETGRVVHVVFGTDFAQADLTFELLGEGSRFAEIAFPFADDRMPYWINAKDADGAYHSLRGFGWEQLAPLLKDPALQLAERRWVKEGIAGVEVQAWLDDAYQLDDLAKRNAAIGNVRGALASDDEMELYKGLLAYTSLGQIEFDKASFHDLFPPLLKSDTASIRKLAATALVMAGIKPGDLDLLLELAGDPDPDIRQSLAWWIVQATKYDLTGKAASDVILRLLAEQDFRFRKEVMRSMWGSKYSPEIEARVLELSRSTEPEEEYNTLYFALSTQANKSEATVQRLIEFLAHQETTNFSPRAAWGLGFGVAEGQRGLVADAAIRVMTSRYRNTALFRKMLDRLEQYAGEDQAAGIRELLAKPGIQGDVRKRLERILAKVTGEKKAATVPDKAAMTPTGGEDSQPAANANQQLETWIESVFQLDDAAKKQNTLEEIRDAIASNNDAEIKSGLQAFTRLGEVQFDKAAFHNLLSPLMKSSNAEIRALAAGAWSCPDCGREISTVSSPWPTIRNSRCEKQWPRKSWRRQNAI